ncbi:MAG: S53 family peptidase, partial [Myxococcales bacterium]|nr:S53 family peptidase [Myxococcales bacterium]
GDALPPGWTCGGKGGGGGGGRGAPTKPGGGGSSDCSFEPLLFASYDTHAGADDVVAGDATIDVTLRKQMFFKSVNVTAFTFDVSFDDGASWTAASATPLGDGRFQVTYAQPAGAQFASIKISATDDQGNGLEQTIFHAYPLAPLPPASSTPEGPRVAADACTGSVPTPFAQCMARVTPESQAGRPKPVTGLTPADLASAYDLPAAAGAGRTIAIVDAYDDPNAEADMNFFRAWYGLPPCTTENGCFRKVNQRGAEGPLPWADTGWGVEISLDLDAVSATCPGCRIILVEADSPSLFDLAPSVDTAVALGADVVSNSYGSIGEFSGETWFDQFYKHDGTAIVVSSGDYGYGNGLPLVGGVSYPAASEFVTAVGGTTLVRDGSPRGWSESVWAGSTSGCSAYIHKPGWQKDDLCKKRTVADIAAVGDPQTGLAVYDTYGFNGWLVVGGTSLSAPIIASIYAMAGNTGSVKNASNLYRTGALFFDAVGGSNGNCSGTYLCTGLVGYDAPTGLGTPNGTEGF